MTPKRKRNDTLLPQIDSCISEQCLPASEPDSPRSNVANNLLNLAIHDGPISSYDNRTTLKKRHVHRGVSADVYPRPFDSREHGTTESVRALVTPPKDISPMDSMEGIFEISETPGAYGSFASQLYPSSPPMSPSPSPLKLGQDQSIADSEEEEDEVVASHRGRFEPRRNSSYRSTSHTTAGRRCKTSATDFDADTAALGASLDSFRKEQKREQEQAQDTAALTASLEVLREKQQHNQDTTTFNPPTRSSTRRKARCAAAPVTLPPPPTPVTSPGEELGQPLAQAPSPAVAAATRLASSAVPNFPLPDLSADLSSPAKKRRKSPPPPHGPTSHPVHQTATSPENMTWHDDEITGHLWNPDQDMDDDGEGINGIGFRPTAAIEWKRRESRKKQVSEWKAREAREERKRRFDRRKRGSGGPDGTLRGTAGKTAAVNSTVEDFDDDGQEAKRARVRFAGVA